jgi:hypothetical protein
MKSWNTGHDQRCTDDPIELIPTDFLGGSDIKARAIQVADPFVLLFSRSP